MSRYKSGDNESNNNEDKVCLLLDNVDGSYVKSRARSRVGLHDHRSCNHGITIAFLFGVSSDKQVIKLFATR